MILAALFTLLFECFESKIINFYQNMPDTIYDDLKEQGLILSEGATLTLPPIRPPKPTLAGKMVSSIVPDIGFKVPPGPHPLVLLPILNSAVIIGRANTLICYKFQIEKESSRPAFQPPKVENLPFIIKQLHLCDSKFLNDRGEVPFLIEGDDRLVLFYVDLKQYKLTEKNTLTYSNLFSVRFLCQKEVLIMTRAFELHHYTIQSGKIKLKNKKICACLPQLAQDQFIQHCQIVGSIDEEQDSTITMFYLVKKRPSPKTAEQDKNFQILKVKEYIRTFEGKIDPIDEDFVVLSNTRSSVLPQRFQIWNFDTFYCIQTKFQVLILKKKFKKYLFIDNVMQNINDCNLRINPGAVISSHNSEVMELSIIQFGDPKCFSKILDTINLKPTEGFTLRMVWPFMNQKETCLMVAFEKEKTVSFYNLIKMKPMEKMLQVVKGIEDKRNISMVQEIAVNLGINKKDFYLTLWQSSPRQVADIYTFLIPCGDVSSIKKQIRLTMRRRKIPVPEFIRILERISTLIKQELKTNLSQQMLKQYIKNDFLLRKVKLKQKQKSMDHRDLQKVYDSSIVEIFAEIVKNDICPQQKKVDPLHATVDPPDPQVMDLRHIFQEFRIVILQNYKKFLVDFLAQFDYDKIQDVIKGYSSILLPKYPFELNMVMHENDYKTEQELKQQMTIFNNKQNLWFSHMTSVQFSREMSKERIQRQLHEYYPTSKISDAVNTLVNSKYGATQKLKKHSLISCTIDEYKQKIKEIYNTKLFLKVCEYANQKQGGQNDQSGQLSAKLVKIFKKENTLTGDALETVSLYSSMHKFMLQNQFCQKKHGGHSGFTTEELMDFSNQDLIALFFLQNRQRKEFIFNQFRDLYVKLYDNPDKFNDAIRQFIHSENCSRIQLQIFIKEVTNKGIDFQIENQPLIELLIDGFCMKLQIREDTDTKHFIQLMEQIQLSKQIGMKMNKIIQIRRCLGILNVFNCEKITYYDMLEYQRNNRIFKILLEKYFNQECKRDSVRIEDEEISLDYCRNMLTVLLYILETIYYDVSQRDLLLTYGQMLIEWKQFDVIKGILFDEQVLEKLHIDKESYIEELVGNALYTIYADDTIAFDEEVKRQIEDILDILPQTNEAFKRRELIKLQLVQIFEEWGVVIQPSNIHLVCSNWEMQIGKEEFITDVFNGYIEHLTFENFKAIYAYLEIATNQPYQSEDQILMNPNFAGFALKFAQRLLKIQRYRQIIEIFAFVKRIPDTRIDYELMTQVFLKEMVRLYPEEKIEQGRQVIEYFTQNYTDDEIMGQLFTSNFEDVHFNEHIQRDDKILIEETYCFKKERGEIGVDLLWKVACDETTERKDGYKTSTSFTEEIYYAYFFLLSSFRNPRIGLQKIDRISYNLEVLTNILFRLDAAIDDVANLWVVNTNYFFKGYFKGLLLIGVARVVTSNQDQNTISRHSKSIQHNLEVIKNRLKDDKPRNKDLLDSITRLQPIIKAVTKKSEKEVRYEKEKFKEMSSQPKQEVVQEKQPQIVINNATMNLRTMREMKYEYTQLSNLSIDYISEKDVLEAIYTKIFEQNQNSRKAKRDQAGGPNTLFLTGLTGHKKEQIQSDINERVPRNEGDYILQTYSRDEVINAVRSFYEDKMKSFNEIVELLENLRLGQPRKINLCKLLKYIQCQIPTQDLQKVFSFDFFMSGEGLGDDDFKEVAYREIIDNIQILFLERDNEYIRTMAMFVTKFLESNAFIERVYVDSLIYITRHCDFTPEVVVRYRTLMELISAETMRQNLERVLEGVREKENMRTYVKKELEIWAKQAFPEDATLIALIRRH